MQSKISWAFPVLVLVLLSSVTPAETIRLKGGQEVSASIIKSDKDVIFCDLGFDILRLPRSEIVEILKQTPEHEDPRSSPGETLLPQPSTDRMHYSAGLTRTSIEANTKRFAEAVVLVSCPVSLGSGFMINERGYVVTNYHVIANETHIKITVFHETGTGFEQQHYKQVKIIALNPFEDLALLKIEDASEPFKHVYLGDANQIEAGESVFAIGNPLGLTRSVSQGIVSAVIRNHSGRLYVQTTTAINPGNSGGPLFNLKGEVIGVTSMGYLYLGGLNFAIPVDVVKRFVDNWDAFAFNEDNPNSGYRYLQPGPRKKRDPRPTVPD